jgi:hypothetical protein
MKLYLAGPMRGIDRSNFPAFHAAAKELRDFGHQVFSPAENDIEYYGESATGDYTDVPEFCLRDALHRDLEWICKHADGIALLRGWETSKGATAENATAVALGLRRMIQDVQGGWVWADAIQEH